MLIGIESAGAVACCSSIVGVSLGWLRWLDVAGRRGLVVALSFLGSCCGVEMVVELKELSGLVSSALFTICVSHSTDKRLSR